MLFAKLVIMLSVPMTLGTENLGDETRLLQKLFTNYNSAARPVKFANKSVIVKIHFNLRHIIELDLKNEILSVKLWAFYMWKDESLVWNETDFNGLEALHIPCDKIWLPDIVLINGIHDREMETNVNTVVVESDGRVLWLPPLYLRALCAVDVRFYPFDDQECNLTFVPWSHTAKTVQLSLLRPKIDTEKYSATSFDLLYAEQKAHTDFVQGRPTNTKVVVVVKFRRKILYHTYTIIWPFVMISILNLLIFRITPESGEKISLGITVLLAFLVLLSIISEKMPESSKSIPLIALYMCFIMGMTNLSIALSVMVPRWLHWLLLHKLGCLVILKGKNGSPVAGSSSSVRRTQLKRSIVRLVSTIQNNRFRTLTQTQNENSCTVATSPQSGVSEEMIYLLNEILNALKAILYKQELGEEQENVRQEWRAVALVLDRLFFWIFAILTAIVSIYLLLLLPN